ncbi:glutamate carboxypeptidase II [Basidiobolus meristosporus CBS 931.73]|uniref:Peptide hydrolase n=1 Tax=Basidiobolus meristosporus CBS 931.73 TaxID=1314790 RepID=A0A1Y1Y931_9FUNG|nr:glutamate carboxypeptidase II [Basidiobolus meristosporus CBS 931.73]|eukprot:ORX94493.1 glutamate carboxypeptidase II [Basidiobolus meristosporus CBS 931.73]
MKSSTAFFALASSILAVNACDSEWLQRKITLQGLLRHTNNFQKFANAHNHTRVFGSEGHQKTVDYIHGIVKNAGYDVTIQEFTAPYSETLAQKLSVNGKEYDIQAMTLTASTPEGGLTAPLVLVPDVAGEKGSAGCEDGDFAGLDLKGKIALVERGSCAFNNKSLNAGKLGAVATIVYNNAAGDLKGTLGAEDTSKIPTGGISQESGKALIELLKKGEVKVALNLVEFRENRSTYNVIAETKGGDASKVVMLGAHSDSVQAGPGINDNGSGSAALLELAYQFRNVKPKNKVRFAWWSAEEFGLLGSEYYVSKLQKTGIANIAVMLNFDMVASPNYVIRVYNGDESGQPVPAGSEVVTKLFEDHFKAKKISYVSGVFPFSRSDVGPFAAAGIPSGGLDTGAEKLKTEEEAKLFGGKAGEPYDKCYHLACDTTANLAHKAFLINGRGIAHAVATYSQDVSTVAAARGGPAKKTKRDVAPVHNGSGGCSLPKV